MRSFARKFILIFHQKINDATNHREAKVFKVVVIEVVVVVIMMTVIIHSVQSSKL